MLTDMMLARRAFLGGLGLAAAAPALARVPARSGAVQTLIWPNLLISKNFLLICKCW